MSFRSLPGRALACALTAAAAVCAGYLLLWHGGTTTAAVSLVIGYVVLLPLALLLAARDGTPTDLDDAPPWTLALGVGGGVLALYVMTLAPTTSMWDASEYIAAAKVLGIPHPPGNPLFVLLAHSFGALPIPIGYAARLNLLAALTSALSAALWCLVAHRMLRGWGLPRVPRAVIAAVAAGLGATAFTVWNQSVVNEKVYTVAMLGLAASSWLALRWADAAPGSRRGDALLALIALIAGLGYANHPAGFLPLPAVGLFVLLTRPGTVLRWRALALCGVMLGTGLSVFAYQPIRAAHHPAINVGAPTACTNGPRLDCTLTAETWRKLMANVNREQYGGHTWAERKAPIEAQVGMWWQYFRWQWWRDAFGEQRVLQALVAWTFLLLALFGGVQHWRRDRRSFAFIAPLLFTLTPLLIVYLNFRYGATQSPELGGSVDREVRDRDYFYLWSFASGALWIGLGLGSVWQAIATRLARAGTPRWALASPVLLVAALPLVGNWSAASRRGQDFTAQWARDLLRSLDPYAVLITNGDNDSFPVWYAQLVEGVRPDVTLAIVPYLNMPWFGDHLLRQPVAPYRGDGLVPVAQAGPVPSVPVLNITAEQVNEVPEVAELPTAMRFVHAGIDAQVPAGVYTRDQLMALRIIQSVVPQRPVYFSIGPYAQLLGLGDHVVIEGLAQRLVTQPARTLPGVVATRGGWMDVAKTRQLWARYQGPQSLLRQGQWVDAPSASIAGAYIVTGQWLADTLVAAGDTTAARATLTTAARMAQVRGVGGGLGGGD
ncbi:MAG: DUF2723 domain-containing protein [Gemmatimonadaceae bacterium]|jgi:hypothetical protein|nr:DUF2723 domain-containing protein [Gemmatimonadaceae bacterium]